MYIIQYMEALAAHMRGGDVGHRGKTRRYAKTLCKAASFLLQDESIKIRAFFHDINTGKTRLNCMVNNTRKDIYVQYSCGRLAIDLPPDSVLYNKLYSTLKYWIPTGEESLADGARFLHAIYARREDRGREVDAAIREAQKGAPAPEKPRAPVSRKARAEAIRALDRRLGADRESTREAIERAEALASTRGVCVLDEKSIRYMRDGKSRLDRQVESVLAAMRAAIKERDA